MATGEAHTSNIRVLAMMQHASAHPSHVRLRCQKQRRRSCCCSSVHIHLQSDIPGLAEHNRLGAVTPVASGQLAFASRVLRSGGSSLRVAQLDLLPSNTQHTASSLRVVLRRRMEVTAGIQHSRMPLTA